MMKKLLLLIPLILGLISSPGICATKTISSTGGNWSSSTAWSPTGLPAVGDDIVATSSSGELTVNSARTCGSMDLTGYTHDLILGANLTVTGNLTLPGTSGFSRMYIYSSVRGTPRTISVGGTVTASNVDFEDVIGAGAANWDLSSATGGSGDCGGNSGITFTTPSTVYRVSTHSGNWTSNEWMTTSGGSTPINRVPLCQDTARWDANSFPYTKYNITSFAYGDSSHARVTAPGHNFQNGDTVYLDFLNSYNYRYDHLVSGVSGSTFLIDTPYETNETTGFVRSDPTISVNYTRLSGFDFRGVRNEPIWSYAEGYAPRIYGDFYVDRAMTFGLWNSFYLYGRGNYGFNPAGVGMKGITVDAKTGTYTLDGYYIEGSGLGLTSGGFSFGSDRFQSTAGGNMRAYLNGFASSNTNTRSLDLGTKAIHIVGGNWVVNGTNLTLTPGTSKIVFNGWRDSVDYTQTFTGGGKTYNDIVFTQSTGSVIFTDSNTFHTFEVWAPRTMSFAAGSTTTINKLVCDKGTTIQSSTNAAHYLVSSGGVQVCDYAIISNSHASPANTWYAGQHSVDGGGNSGWNFTDPPLTFNGLRMN